MSFSKDSQKDVFSEYGLNTQSQRDKLLGWGKILVYLGWILTALTAVAILTLTISMGSNFNWGLFGILFGVLVASQGIRIVGRMMKKKSEQMIPFSEKKLSLMKSQREKEVREYFDSHKVAASKLMQMKSLAKQGKYKDAYNIASSLLKTDIPIPIRDFLLSRKNEYAKLRK
ncbi:MAG: hypothetical protein ACTSRE_05085 [Promethearchaeota archaeon]